MKQLSLIMKKAWQIRQAEPSIENPLREAWRRFRIAEAIVADGNIQDIETAFRLATKTRHIINAMKSGDVSFAYLNKAGEVRQAVGRFVASNSSETKDGSKRRTQNVRYFDVEKNATRSFLAERVVGIVNL